MGSYMLKVDSEKLGGKGVMPCAAAFIGGMTSLEVAADIKAVSINLNDMVDIGGNRMSVKDLIATQMMDNTFLDSIPRITKEQFYTLE